MVNEFEREWILTHRDELQDRRSEIAPLDLGRIELGELGERLLRVQTETLALALLHQHAVMSPRHSPLASSPLTSRPARPVRCHAAALEMFFFRKCSIATSSARDPSKQIACADIPPDVRKMYSFSFLYPVSMTDTTPGIVNDVSAMLVATMTLRVCLGAVAKIFAWAAGGREA